MHAGPDREASPGARTILFFLVWCVTGVIGAWVIRGGGEYVIPVIFTIQGFDSLYTVGWLLVLRRDILPLYGRLRSAVGGLLIPAAVSYPMAFAIHALVTWLGTTFRIPVEVYNEDFLREGYGWHTAFLCVAVQPALIEELAFRGIIQATLERIMKPSEAIVVTSIAFSIMHFSVVMFLPLFFMGLYFGWLRHRWNSLYPAMLAHLLHNSIVLLDEAIPIFPL